MHQLIDKPAQSVVPRSDPGVVRKVDSRHEQLVINTLVIVLSLLAFVIEITLVRVFSYSLNPQLVYMAISVAMLGFGAAGTTLSMCPSLMAISRTNLLAACSLLFGTSTVVASAVFAHSSSDADASLWSGGTLHFVLFSFPFFFAGVGVVATLTSNINNVGRTYFLNMAGSALGCVLVYPLLRLFGAESLLLIAALLSSTAGFLSLSKVRLPLRLLAFAAVLLPAVAMKLPAFVAFQPDKADFPHSFLRLVDGNPNESITSHRQYAAWDPIAKVEVYELPGKYGFFAGDVPVKLFTQDAGSMSAMMGFAHHPIAATHFARGSVYGLATMMRPHADVLIVGLGGAPDLAAVLALGANSVTAVEINQANVELVRQQAAYLGLDSPNAPPVTIKHADGRAFFRTAHERFDVIQMTGAETWAAGTVSAALLSEYYLYTKEAFIDALNALKSDGLIAITRFGADEPRRVATTALEVLADRGVHRPDRHIAVIHQGKMWGTVLIAKNPFSPDDLARLIAIVNESDEHASHNSFPYFESIGFGINGPFRPGYLPDASESTPATFRNSYSDVFYSELMEHSRRGELRAWYLKQQLDYSPTTDDRPFFFQMGRMQMPTLNQILSPPPFTAYSWNLSNYISLTLNIGIWAFALILLPLVAFRKKRVSHRVHDLPALGFFFAIGLGYMLVEIGLMQRLSLFTGHPQHAISVVATSLLLSSGFGSFLASTWRATDRTKAATGLLFVIVIGIGYQLLLPSLANALLLDEYARIALSAACIVPLGFVMGIPFATALRLVGQRSAASLPWAVGVNGFAAVLATLAAVPLATKFGFGAVLCSGVISYLLASVCFYFFGSSRITMQPSLV
jgi:spermidine synthase